MTEKIAEIEERNRTNGLEYIIEVPEEVERMIPDLRAAGRQLRSMVLEDRFEIVRTMMENWTDPQYGPRKIALPRLAKKTRFPLEMIEFYSFSCFSQMTKMNSLLRMDLSQLKKCFTDFSEISGLTGILLRARMPKLDMLKMARRRYDMGSLLENAPELITSICAANVPGLPVHQMNLALILGSASIIRNSERETILGPAYLESIIDEGYSEVANAFKILLWDKVNTEVTRYVVENSDAIVLTGGIDAVRSIESLIKDSGKDVLFDPHGHKAGMTVISREYLMDEERARQIARCCAIDIVAWNQYACLSPREIRIETGGRIDYERFAEILDKEMAVVGEKLGTITDIRVLQKLDDKHKVYSSSYYFKVKSDPRTLRFGLVICTGKHYGFDPYSDVCLDRTIVIKPISDIFETIDILKNHSELLQTIVVAIPEERIIPYAEKLSEIGVSNIHSVGNAAFVRIGEPWDSKFVPYNLLDLQLNRIRWTALSKDIDGDIDYRLKGFEEYEPSMYAKRV